MVDENDFAGLGDGPWDCIEVKFKAAIIYQVVHHGLRGGGGKGFAIGQPVAQIGRQMPPEKRSARIFGRPHAPLAKPASEFPNVGFDLFNDFVVIDGHDGLRFVPRTSEVGGASELFRSVRNYSAAFRHPVLIDMWTLSC
jgi:hypothetical protein